MKHSHTTKTKKAKCLAYRNDKRCGRVARMVVEYGNHRQSVCQECADRIGGKVLQESPNGFTVEVNRAGGWVARSYVEIESTAQCSVCGRRIEANTDCGHCVRINIQAGDDATNERQRVRDFLAAS